MEKQNIKSFLNSQFANFAIVGVIFISLFFVFGLQKLGIFGSNWGILPRTFELKGFFMAPFMHGSWSHLMSNMSALIVLLPMTVILYKKEAIKALPIIWITSFITVWIFGAPNSSHIGASGIIYGLMSFSIFYAIFKRSWKSLIGCLIVATLFSGALMGLLPKEGVSFTAHFGGALGGFIASYFLRKRKEII